MRTRYITPEEYAQAILKIAAETVTVNEIPPERLKKIMWKTIWRSFAPS